MLKRDAVDVRVLARTGAVRIAVAPPAEHALERARRHHHLRRDAGRARARPDAQAEPLARMRPRVRAATAPAPDRDETRPESSANFHIAASSYTDGTLAVPACIVSPRWTRANRSSSAPTAAPRCRRSAASGPTARRSRRSFCSSRPTRSRGARRSSRGWIEAIGEYLAQNGLAWEQVSSVGLAIPGPYLRYGVLGHSANMPRQLRGLGLLQRLQPGARRRRSVARCRWSSATTARSAASARRSACAARAPAAC